MTKLLPLLSLLLLTGCASQAVDRVNPTAGLVTFALICAIPWLLSIFLTWALTSRRIQWHGKSKNEEE